MTDTIVSLATPSGRSGIGVVRLSGPDSQLIYSSLTAGDKTLAPRKAHLVKLIDPETSDVLDETVVTFFKSPHSFTGEDVIEISCHGSPVLLRQVLDICLAEGCRLAEPGEYSLRALANGRIDLAEAEAIRDLIDARTSASTRQAVRQLQGEFSHRLQPIKDQLISVIVLLESALEFVEDDLPATQTESIVIGLRKDQEQLTALADTFKAGHLIRDGLSVAFAGRPNVGKSSLFNGLVGSERAIVTEIAGTTRDQITETIAVNGVPVQLIDTAGLRESEDTIEAIGVKRSRRTIADADLVVFVIDASEGLIGEDLDIYSSLGEIPCLVAINKLDKAEDGAEDNILRSLSELARAPDGVVSVSARTGAGLDKLRSTLLDPFDRDGISLNAGFLVTDARHHDLLRRAAADISESAALLEQHSSEEIVLVGLHNALRSLGEITGETTTEHILTQIFSTFCIGK